MKTGRFISTIKTGRHENRGPKKYIALKNNYLKSPNGSDGGGINGCLPIFAPLTNYEIGEAGMSLELIKTADGSHSLYNTELDEVYHSKNGALAESEHVFIRAGYEYICSRDTHVRLLEVGFGTGLNALLTALRSTTTGVPVRYLTIEPCPLNDDLLRQLNYCAFLPDNAGTLWKKIHASQWEMWIPVTEGFQLLKILAKIEDHPLPESQFNLVYFDAFAPGVQAELWETGIFQKLWQAMSTGGALVTYSAKGAVRRNLEKAGFAVERLPGPAGKREMIRAVKVVSG